MTPCFCLIAVDCPMPALTYIWEQDAAALELKPGELVEVPFGKRSLHGLVLKVNCGAEGLVLEKIRPITKRLPQHFTLDQREIDFFQWISVYYHYPIGKLIFESLPKLLKRPRALQYEQGIGEELSFTPNADQVEIIEKLLPLMDQGFSRSLVHGVTGSGKTVIYLRMMQEAIARGKSVLFLLPEINLTPQFLKTFITHLAAPIYSYNSSVTDSDKYGLWKLLMEDHSPKVVIGVRSSIFLPLKELGLVIVDEEHDSSFKQDDRCPYNARDLAIKKANLYQIPVVLGSATPSMESYYSFALSPRDKTFYFKMKNRAGKGELPKIEMLDMRYAGLSPEQIQNEKTVWPFTIDAIAAITEALEKKEQVLVFVNRLGFANYLQCRACGHQFFCPNCSTNLRYFKNRNEVSCQYCNYVAPAPQICPKCQNMTLHQKGFGTERLQEILAQHFPQKTIERFDRDEIKNMQQLEDRLDTFHRGEIDIMVGTQMLSKGHNFERVNLVVILGIDSQLNFPDFRASEKVYQLLTQVSGRSGRFGQNSKVMILSLGVANQVFSYVKTHSFDQFYKDELVIRQLCQCPPISKLAMIYLTSSKQDKVIEDAVKAGELLGNLKKTHFPKIEVLGPRPAMVEKRANKFTWNLMLRSDDINQLHNAITSFQNNLSSHHSVSLKIDIDPYTLI